MKRGTMLSELHRVEAALPELLLHPEDWQSVLVDYEQPQVERVWRAWEGLRISLHRIQPCIGKEALFHPHPWPSAMRICEGAYRMDVGYGAGNEPPPIAATLILTTGSLYEMVEIDGWHSVDPCGAPTMSLMVTGTPWGRASPKSDHPLRGLDEMVKREILELFQGYYR